MPVALNRGGEGLILQSCQPCKPAAWQVHHWRAGSGGLAGFDPGLQVGGGGFGGFVPQAGLDEALAGVAAALEDGTQAELGDGEGIGAGLAPCLEGWPVRQLRLATVEREPVEALAVGRAGISGADHLTQGIGWRRRPGGARKSRRGGASRWGPAVPGWRLHQRGGRLFPGHRPRPWHLQRCRGPANL
jgi:hypothetical protein